MARPVALVTGGGQRLGAAIVEELINDGWYVLVHVRNSVEQATQNIAAIGKKLGKHPSLIADILIADLADIDGVNSLAESVVEHPMVDAAGGLAGLVHNASFYSHIEFKELSDSDIAEQCHLHLTVPIILTQVLSGLLANAQGAVVGMLDTSHGKAWGGLTHYTSTKAALRQALISMSKELAPAIRVNGVSPGAILPADWEESSFREIIRSVPLGRAGTPQDIANAVKFMLTSPYVTGQILAVDGGWSIN